MLRGREPRAAGTDLKVVAQAGLRVTAAVTLSLLLLGGISLALIGLLHLA